MLEATSTYSFWVMCHFLQGTLEVAKTICLTNASGQTRRQIHCDPPEVIVDPHCMQSKLGRLHRAWTQGVNKSLIPNQTMDTTGVITTPNHQPRTISTVSPEDLPPVWTGSDRRFPPVAEIHANG